MRVGHKVILVVLSFIYVASVGLNRPWIFFYTVKFTLDKAWEPLGVESYITG